MSHRHTHLLVVTLVENISNSKKSFVPFAPVFDTLTMKFDIVYYIFYLFFPAYQKRFIYNAHFGRF